MEALSIFDLMYEEYKINKPIRLIEFFAGYGSQALALKYLGANFEHYRICEWAMNSIIAYADLHRNELPFYDKDFSKPLTKEEISEYLFKKGVSIDYSKPATLDQLKRAKEDKLRLCYNAIQCTCNLVDISRVKGQDLKIEETEKFTYLLTRSHVKIYHLQERVQVWKKAVALVLVCYGKWKEYCQSVKQNHKCF